MKIIVQITSNYVTNRIVVGDDYVLAENEREDIDQCIGIGDWYEASEGVFYRPVNAVPPDSPFAEMQP